jgi:hypothetical protein
LPATSSPVEEKHGQKRTREDDAGESPTKKVAKISSPPSPVKSSPKAVGGKKPKSATSNKNMTLKSSPTKKVEQGTQRITNFFTK